MYSQLLSTQEGVGERERERERDMNTIFNTHAFIFAVGTVDVSVAAVRYVNASRLCAVATSEHTSAATVTL